MEAVVVWLLVGLSVVPLVDWQFVSLGRERAHIAEQQGTVSILGSIVAH